MGNCKQNSRDDKAKNFSPFRRAERIYKRRNKSLDLENVIDIDHLRDG